ncbi:MAG TPA: ArsA family ATPase, partial [Polyangia bacterium]
MTAPTFIFFGGKGGVGKTTCAAARAVAEAAGGADVLAISTDPAHSLGDALAARLSARVTRVPIGRSQGLFAVELDATRALARWMREHRRALGEAIEHGTWLDREDIANLLALTIPGVDELVAMLEIARLAGEHVRAAARAEGSRTPATTRRGRSARRALVVVDTAPTGHTLRLLAAPDALAAIARLLDGLQERHRTIRREFGGAIAPDAADALLDLMAQQAASAHALLRDGSSTMFEWVTLPERLALDETTEAIESLRRAGIRIHGLIVNRVVPDGPRCPLCDRRRLEERRVVAALRRTIRVPARLVPAELAEPRGVTRLARLGRALVGRADRPATSRRASAAAAPPVRPSVEADAHAAARAEVVALAGSRVVFFAGKGGVG